MRKLHKIFVSIRVLYRVLKVIPKLQRKIKNVQDPEQKAALQKRIITEELLQIPGYREILHDRALAKRKLAHQVGQKAVTTVHRQMTTAPAPYNFRNSKKYLPRAEEITWQNQNPAQIKNIRDIPAASAKATGFEDYPFLDDLLK